MPSSWIPIACCIAEKKPREKLLRDHLFLFEMRIEALAILQTRHTPDQVRKTPVKFAKHGHVIQHFAGGVNFAAQAAFNELPREL